MSWRRRAPFSSFARERGEVRVERESSGVGARPSAAGGRALLLERMGAARLPRARIAQC